MENKNDLAIYQTESGALELRADARAETIRANLKQIATLFGRDKSVISRHLKNIFDEGELDIEVVVAYFATVQKEGRKDVKKIDFCYSDRIISIGKRLHFGQHLQFQ